MLQHAEIRPQSHPRPVARVAALSFAVGLIALRLCWLPGVNCVLAGAALILGLTSALIIMKSHGALGGVEEAISGIVLGLVVLGLSVFFITAFVAAYR